MTQAYIIITEGTFWYTEANRKLHQKLKILLKIKILKIFLKSILAAKFRRLT